MKKIEDSFEGRVVNGRIEWKGGKLPPDGASVRAKPLRTASGSMSKRRSKLVDPVPKNGKDDLERLYQDLLSLAGCVKRWPKDMADHHDHYIHGTRKS